VIIDVTHACIRVKGMKFVNRGLLRKTSELEAGPIGKPFLREVLDGIANLGVGVKVSALLLGLGLLPPLAALFFMPQVGIDHVQNVIALYIAVFLILYYPLAKAMKEFLVMRPIRRINAYIDEVKAGRRTPAFVLPAENGGEHDFLQLHRNIFWMVHGLETREAKLHQTLVKLDQARRQVIESLEYAGLIQRSFLPSRQLLGQTLGEHFVLWLPRDKVGGDAYWIRHTPEFTLLAVFDCTGHGVPGAFLTLIVNALLDQNHDEACFSDPGRLLSKLNRGIKEALSQYDAGDHSDDGLEGCVCSIDRQTGVLHFSGAGSLAFLVGQGGIREIRGDRSGIGFVHVPADRTFVNHRIGLDEVDKVYLLTDGIMDQIGGPKRLPFGRRRMREWIENNQNLSMADQCRSLQQVFSEYKGVADQRDDVTVLGFYTKERSC
jgi:phosphoserine phosphatase RsbU/P